MRKLLLVLVVAVVSVAMLGRDADVARAFAPPIVAPPVLPPLVGAGVSGAVAVGTSSAAVGAVAAAAAPIVAAGVVAAGAGYLIGWGLAAAFEWGGFSDGDSTTGGGAPGPDGLAAMGFDHYAGPVYDSVFPVTAELAQVDTSYRYYWLTVHHAETRADVQWYCSEPPGTTGGWTAGSHNLTVDGPTKFWVTCAKNNDTVDGPSVLGEVWVRPDSASIVEWDKYTTMALPDDSPRRLRAEADCITADGVTTGVSLLGDTYVPGGEPMTPEIACPDGSRMTRLKVDRIVEGSSVPPRTVLEHAVPAEQLDPAHPYADCLVGDPCTLRLVRQLPDGQIVDCNRDDGLCVGWAGAANRADVYECQWGPYALGLEQCAALEGAYAPGPNQGKTTVIDTATPVLPSPVAAPAPATDPAGWATKLFVPTQWPQRADELNDVWSTRPPGSIVGLVDPVIDGLWGGWVGSCGLLPHFMPSILIEKGVDKEAARLPCEPPTTAWDAVYAFLVVVILVGTAVRVFLMVQGALGAHSTGDDVQGGD